MSERRSATDLGPGVEAALRNFPLPERDWERDALAVEARLPHAGATDAALLAPPLPSEPGELSAPPSATTTPLTHSGVRPQSLAELARRSVEKKQTAERAMARESLALAAKRPSAEEVQALREVMNQRRVAPPPSAPVVTQVSASQPRAKGVVSAQDTAALPASGVQGSHPSWSRLGLLAAGIAMAAGFLFWLRRPGPPASTGAPGAAVTAAQTPVAAVSTTTANRAANAATPTATPEPAATGVNPDTLPKSEPASAEPARPKAAVAPAPSARASGPKAEKIELEDDTEQPVASAAPGRPEASVAKALPPDPALRPADSTGGAVPAKPSSGAVQAALGAVMSGARRCVAGDDTPSSALVVFGSDGRVQSVSVSGPAAGRPAGGCIEAQLGRARVQPFAASSFSVSATVRPD
jgi:hypothetical protein